jgi:hypothetical protein
LASSSSDATNTSSTSPAVSVPANVVLNAFTTRAPGAASASSSAVVGGDVSRHAVMHREHDDLPCKSVADRARRDLTVELTRELLGLARLMAE